MQKETEEILQSADETLEKFECDFVSLSLSQTPSWILEERLFKVGDAWILQHIS